MHLLVLSSLLACANKGSLVDCPDGQVLDDDGNCVDDGDGGIADGGADGGGTDGGQDCGIAVSFTSPADGETGVDLGTLVRFDLSGADATAGLSLATESGVAVAGTAWLDEGDTQAWFQPAAPLSRATTYVATLDYCAGSHAISFTTTDPGEPVSSLVGRGWSVDLTAATWTEPAALGSLLASYIDANLLLGVSEATSTTISMYGTLADARGAQNTCEPTVDFPTADFRENPYFQLGPLDLALPLGSVTATIENLRLTGRFNADASQIQDGTLQGQVDMRELGVLFQDLIGTSDPTTVCSILSGFGASCVACASDGSVTCLNVAIEDITGRELSGGVDEIDQENCHPDCAASYTNSACDRSGW